MCLKIKHGSGLNRAKEDIICYKVVRVDVRHTAILSKEIFLTPYQETPISNEVINGRKPFIAKDYKGEEINEEALFEMEKPVLDTISGCAIHTFATKNGAKTEATEIRDIFILDKFCVYKCIIPKGTLYYEGIYDHKKSFASHKIVFKERVLK